MVEEQVIQAFHSLRRRFDARHLIQLGSRLVAEQQCRERCDRHFHHMVRLAVGRHTVSFFKEECEAVLLDIRDKCFIKEVYLFDQSNRIDVWMKKNYGTTPEFMWDDTPGFGVYRNEISRKWYALIMNLSRKKIVPESENKEVEVMNLHTGNETEECLKRKGIYPCYHMNKKSYEWRSK